jgi:hypothetical protein
MVLSRRSSASSEHPGTVSDSFIAVGSAYFEAASSRNLGGVVFWDNSRLRRFRDGRAICSRAMIPALAGSRVYITIRFHTVSGLSLDMGPHIKGVFGR